MNSGATAGRYGQQVPWQGGVMASRLPRMQCRNSAMAAYPQGTPIAASDDSIHMHAPRRVIAVMLADRVIER